MRYVQALPNFVKHYIAAAMPAREARAPLEKCARYACYWEVSTAAQIIWLFHSCAGWKRGEKKVSHAPAFYLRIAKLYADADLSLYFLVALLIASEIRAIAPNLHVSCALYSLGA